MKFWTCGELRGMIVFCLLMLTKVQAAEELQAVPVQAPLAIGIGVALRPVKAGEGYEVAQVLPNSPAALCAEIEPGDVIVGVGDPKADADDVDVTRLDFVSAVKLIRGPIDSEVRLRLIPKDNSLIKEKSVVLTRRALYGPDGLGKTLELSFTSLDDRTPLMIDKSRGRPVVLAVWSRKTPGCVAELKKAIQKLAEHRTYPPELELFAVNCDETIEMADLDVDEFKIEGLRQAWIDPEIIAPFTAGVLPFIAVVSPKGELVAACPPHQINLEKFLKRYPVEVKPAE